MKENSFEQDRDIINRYYSSYLENSKPLSSEEEIQLAMEVRAGSLDARNRLVGANLRFLVSVAGLYRNQGLPLDDLIQEGSCGLIRAAEKFDGTKGYKFISYAVWWIRNNILSALNEKTRVVRLPQSRFEARRKMYNLIASSNNESGGDLDPSNINDLEHISKEIGINEEYLLETWTQFKEESLDREIPNRNRDDGMTLLQRIPSEVSSPDVVFEDKELLRLVKSSLDCLEDKERDIVSSYFGLDGGEGIVLEEIGKNMASLERESAK